MRRTAEPAAKQAKAENEAHKEPNANKNRSKDKISNIATLDNGTVVEAFNYLNYCQLAKNSLVSKRFHDVIQTHRHKLALLYVRSIDMYWTIASSAIKVFDKELSPEAYNEWVIRNNYSKQAAIEYQVVSTQSTPNIPRVYRLHAHAYYKDPRFRQWDDGTTVFSTCVELSNDNWPLFQHFIRLATDPFIYIDSMSLIYRNDVFLDLLARAVTPEHSRMKCNTLTFNLQGNNQKSITWTKNHVRCDKLYITGEADLNQDALFDLFLTGSQCTSAINVRGYDFCKALVDFVQKFLDLENWDEYQGVHSIESYKFVKDRDEQLLKNNFVKFLVKEERNDGNTVHVFEIINNAIGKKLQLTAKISDHRSSVFSLKIINL